MAAEVHGQLCANRSASPDVEPRQVRHGLGVATLALFAVLLGCSDPTETESAAEKTATAGTTFYACVRKGEELPWP